MQHRSLIFSLIAIMLFAGVLAGIPAAEAVTVNHRSIGTHAVELCNAGTATVIKGSTSVTFEGVVLPATIGRGDEIVIDDEELYILSRDGDTRLTLQSPARYDHTEQAYAIRRAYTSIQAWVNDRRGDLVREDRLEVGVCYNDGPFTTRSWWELARIHGSVTDPEHFMWLTAAEGAEHQGRTGAGVVLDGRSFTRHGILVADDYTRIEGLELRGFRRNFLAAAVSVWYARGVVLERLLIHDFEWPRFEGAGIEGGLRSEFTARNCIIYDGSGAGIITRWPQAAARVENSTIYGMRGWGIDERLGRVEVVNTIAVGNAKGDFRIKRGTQSHNISSDRSAAGEGSLVFLKAADQFVSIAPGAEDLHLKEGASGVDAGKNLAEEARSRRSALPPAALHGRPATVAADIDGQERIGETAWDIGADEIESSPTGVWFVDAAQAGDGTSWKTAFATIRQAVAAARPGEQIWIREGHYELEGEIRIDKPLSLYGGFAGAERRLEQRDRRERPTVLDGRGITRCLNLAAEDIRVDGLVFQSGYAGSGGAVFAQNVSGILIENCRFESNSAGSGGGLYALLSAGVVRNCVFADNEATMRGGAVYTDSSALTLANCIFAGNAAGSSTSFIHGGGAVYASQRGAVIANCSFYANRTQFPINRGGAVYNFLADTRLFNSILWGNSAAIDPQITNYSSAAATTAHCTIDQDGFAGTAGNIRAEPSWVAPAEEDFRLREDSPCIDAGSGDLPGLPDTDFDGNPRISGLTVDMGAFEFMEE